MTDIDDAIDDVRDAADKPRMTIARREGGGAFEAVAPHERPSRTRDAVRLVVLDEPSAGLDIGQREALTKILGAVAGHAITIVSTHLVEDIIDHAQTITVMNSGRFVFDGSCEDFSDTRSLDAVRRTYLRLVA